MWQREDIRCFAVAEEENEGVVGAGVVGGEEEILKTKWHNLTHFSFEHYGFRQTTVYRNKMVGLTADVIEYLIVLI